MIQKYLMIFIFTLLIITPFFTPYNASGEMLERKCLNEDGTREMDFRFVTGVQEFDKLT